MTQGNCIFLCPGFIPDTGGGLGGGFFAGLGASTHFSPHIYCGRRCACICRAPCIYSLLDALATIRGEKCGLGDHAGKLIELVVFSAEGIAQSDDLGGIQTEHLQTEDRQVHIVRRTQPMARQ